MPYQRPGITQLRDQANADILVASGLPTLLRRSPLRVLGYALAGLVHGVYGYIDWIAKQAVPFTATDEFLEAWAALVGVYRKPATAATGTASFTGPAGQTIPAGTALRATDGSTYTTAAILTLTSSGSGTVGIAAALDGSAYTMTPGMPLALASPIFGVQSGATGQPAVAGTDTELDAPFRTRMLQRWAAPPQGGDTEDYREWAEAVPGVTRAWVKPLGMGAGTVVVYTMWDGAEAANLGFPQGAGGVATAETRDTAAGGDNLAVANALYPLRPATALVYAVAPLPFPVAFAFTTAAALSDALKASAGAALDGVFLALADPLQTLLPISPFETAVAGVPGMPPFTLTAPAAAISASLGYLPIRGAVTWAALNG